GLVGAQVPPVEIDRGTDQPFTLLGGGEDHGGGQVLGPVHGDGPPRLRTRRRLLEDLRHVGGGSVPLLPLGRPGRRVAEEAEVERPPVVGGPRGGGAGQDTEEVWRPAGLVLDKVKRAALAAGPRVGAVFQRGAARRRQAPAVARGVLQQSFVVELTEQAGDHLTADAQPPFGGGRRRPRRARLG